VIRRSGAGLVPLRTRVVPTQIDTPDPRVGYATAKWAADGRPILLHHALLLSWKPAATASLIGAAARPVEADVARSSSARTPRGMSSARRPDRLASYMSCSVSRREGRMTRDKSVAAAGEPTSSGRPGARLMSKTQLSRWPCRGRRRRSASWVPASRSSRRPLPVGSSRSACGSRALGAEPNRMNLDRALAENCRAATRSVASAGSGTSCAGPATPGTTNL
jgi:hypothetical protein